MIANISDFFISAAKPVTAVIGGNADDGKLQLIEQLLPYIDILALGGSIGNTFLKASGGRLGSTEFDTVAVNRASILLDVATKHEVKVFMPTDMYAANMISESAKPSLEGARALFDDKIAMDIGPRTAAMYANLIGRSGTVLWTGSMGIYELPAFSTGTKAVLTAIDTTNAQVFIYGKDSSKSASQCRNQAVFNYL